MTRRRVEVVGLTLLMLAACQSRSELVIGIATDLHATAELGTVELQISEGSDGPTIDQSFDLSGMPTVPYELPGSFGLVADGDKHVTLDLLGEKDNQPFLTRHAVLDVVADQTLFYRLTLVAACVGRDDCPPGTTCVEGSCRDPAVDPSQLPSFDGTLVTQLTCNSGTQFIDTGTGDPMQATADAADCNGNLCVEGTCLDPPAAGSGTRTVVVSQILDFVYHGQTTPTPVDLSSAALSAQTVDGSGNVTSYPGTGSSDGTFTIPGVPVGNYDLVLALGSGFAEHFLESSSIVDLGQDEVGRADVVGAATATSITVNATGLDAWADTDELEAHSYGANTFWFDLEEDVTIAAGATSLTAYTFDDTDASFPSLVTGSDDFELVQVHAAQTAGGVAYRAAAKFFAPASFTQTDGSNTALSGTFATPSQTAAADLQIATTQWDSAVGFDGSNAPLLGPQAHLFVTAQNPDLLVFVRGVPESLAFGAYANGPVFAFVHLAHGTPDVAATGIQYARADSPEAQLDSLQASESFAVTVALPGSSDGFDFIGGISCQERLVGSAATVTPCVGPVLSPTIGGLDLFQPQSGVGVTPTISWSAPMIGAPRSYVVEIVTLALDPTTMATEFVGAVELFTGDTTATVPPGVLAAGQPFIVLIFAQDESVAAPFRSSFPAVQSSVVSAIVTP